MSVATRRTRRPGRVAAAPTTAFAPLRVLEVDQGSSGRGRRWSQLWGVGIVRAGVFDRSEFKFIRLMVLLAVAGVVLGLCGSARAAGPLSWQKAGHIDARALSEVSCPSLALCVAVDNAGNIFTTAHPGARASGWAVAHVDGGNRVAGVSCPSASLCMAVDTAGNVVSSTDPASGPGAWTVVHVDDATNTAAQISGLTGVSCPSVSLCVAVDAVGNVVTSTTPTGGASAWTVTYVDNGIDYECYHYGGSGPMCQPVLVGVSCASGSLCVAIDTAGNVISSSNPTGGKSAWSGASPYSSVPGAYSFNGVACPSVSLCVAVDGYAGEVVTWNPTVSPSTRTPAGISENGLSGVWCSFVSLCFAFDGAKNLFVSTDPTGGASAWTVNYVDASAGTYGVTGVSCPSVSLCVAVDDSGNVFDGRPSPTAAQIKAVLYRKLLPSGHAARIGVLLRRGGYSFSFTAPTAGRVVLSWYLVATRAARRALIASVTSRRFARPGNVMITVRLTRKGKQLLSNATHLMVIAKGRLIPTGKSGITAFRTFTLSR